MKNSLEKIKNSIHIFLAIIFIIVASFLHIHYTGWDSTFPVYGGNVNWIYDKFFYLWSYDVYGTTTFIDKLRLFPVVILNFFHAYSKEIFYVIFNIIGFLSFYISIWLLFWKNNTLRKKIFAVFISLLFVFNPLTFSHLNHTFLLQWYFLYPIILALYYKFLISERYTNGYLVAFLIFLLFLWQPHNYYNIAISGIIITIFVFIYALQNRIFLLKKVFIAFFLSLAVFSFFIIPFVLTHPNDLTSSTANFSGTSPNLIWSWNQWIINTLAFKMSFFEGFNWLLYITIFMNFALLFFIFFKQNIKYKNWILAIFLILISLSFVGKNPIFINHEIREIVYTFIPHIRVDIAYIILLFIPFFYFSLAYFSKNFVKSLRYINILLGFLLIINLGIFSQIKPLDSRENIWEFQNFIHWIDENLKNDIENVNVLMLPNEVVYLFPGLREKIYGNMIFDNISESKSVYFWSFSELMLRDTKKYLSDKMNTTEYIKNTNTKYVLCFEKYCDMLAHNANFSFISSYWKYSLYLFSEYKKIIHYNDKYSFKKRDLVTYDVNLKLWNNNNLDFFQSFHPNWKLYLEPYSEISCKNPHTKEWQILENFTQKYIIESRDTFEKISEKFDWKFTVFDIKELNSWVENEDLKIWQEILLPDQKIKKYAVTECGSSNDMNFIDGIKKISQKPIFDENHKIAYNYANQWTLDAEYIKQNYPKEYYKENEDGTIDVKLTLYFKPQSYFYLGLLISGLTLLSLVIYLIFDFIKTRKNKNAKNS